jgi:hypothetical protein
MSRAISTAFALIGLVVGAVVGLIAAINIGMLLGVDYEHTLQHAFDATMEGFVITALLLAGPALGAVGMWRWARRPRGQHREPGRADRVG